MGDVRYALRTFARRPSFAIGAVAIMAVAIAVNTIAFSLLNSLALRPLPVPHAGRVVRVYPVVAGQRQNLFSYPDFTDYRSQSAAVCESVAAYLPVVVTTGRSSHDGATLPPRAALGYVASAGYFDITGVQPALGRVLQPIDDRRASRSVVLSHAFWQRRFNGDAAVVGATLRINAEPFTIVGVARPGFAGTEPLITDLWIGAGAIDVADPGHRDAHGNRDQSSVLVLARLRAGVSRSQAADRLDVIGRRLAATYPAPTRPERVEVAAGTFFTIDPGLEPIVAVALIVVGLVLLIACGNVANLMLARAVSRQREIAVRLAIGAARARIVRQLVVEALLLSVTAGAAALLLSTWVLRALYAFGVGLLPFSWAMSLTLAPDIRVFAYTLAVAIAGGLAFGLAPALQAVSPDIVRALGDARAIGGRHVSGARLRKALVVVQVAGSMVLLAAAGLLLRGLLTAQALDLGFTTRGVVYGEFDLGAEQYSAQRAAWFTEAMAGRAAAMPGVTAAAITSHVPLHGGVRRLTIRLADRPVADPIPATVTRVSPGYFDVLDIAFVAGRHLTAADAGMPVVVVSDGLARRFWPGDTALGKALVTDAWREPRVVIGVVRDAADGAIWREKEMSVYLPLDSRSALDATAMIVRSSGDPAAVRADLESAAAALDPDLRFTAAPLDALLRLWLLPSRVAAASAGILALLALLLAASGLYAVLSYSVSHRLREIGIRMALGATARDVSALVLADAGRMIGGGLAIGLVAAAAAAPLLGRFLFGVSALDPLTLAIVCAVLGAVGVTAAYVPASRAARLAPLSVLRVE